MTVALLLSSAPLNLRSLEKALRSIEANVALVPIESASLDDDDLGGVAELTRILSIGHSACIIHRGVSTYDPGLFDDVSEARSSIVDALLPGLDMTARNFFVLMHEWEDVESTRLLVGGLNELRAVLATRGGWPPLRLSGAGGGWRQEIYPTLVFEIVSEPGEPDVR